MQIHWILLASRCNHDLKFIIASSKDSKSSSYYITKTSILHFTHIFPFSNCSTKNKIKMKTQIITTIWLTKDNISSYVVLNTIGSKQEISTTKVVTYLLNSPNHIIDHGFTYNLGIICQPWWMNKKKIKKFKMKW